ncbi:endosomal integral membrane protein [Trypanosoma grayi]|uniref:endosomal integral membrane protein n=1 Tax=Trypanosoma grayi TaxID=71804 RepID=UPI0004F477AA|nr:endosomal integral membrane protein [Trypanosoma grayi]KEG11774.1 endosomal integral membrane protein [Trypanosoma grayi]
MPNLLLLVAAIVSCTPLLLSEAIVYVPGLVPTARRSRDEVRLEVNGLHSTTNGVLYPYYEARTPFCPHYEKSGAAFSQSLGLGAILGGERPQWSSYFLYMLEGMCNYVKCEGGSRMSSAQVKWMRNLIEKNYRGHIMVDNLPAYNNGSSFYQGHCQRSFYKLRPDSADVQRGYYLGVPSKCTGGPVYLNNHLHFIVHYHTLSPDEALNYEEKELSDGNVVHQLRKRSLRRKGNKRKERSGAKPVVTMDGDAELKMEFEDDEAEEEALHTIVDVVVRPFSIDWKNVTDGRPDECPGFGDNDDDDPVLDSNSISLSDLEGGKFLPLVLDESLTTRSIAWTYTVEWHEKQDVQWGTRWDAYFSVSSAKANKGTHYLYVVYSVLVVLAMSSTVSMILLRALRRDFVHYNSLLEVAKEQHSETIVEEHGWKAINGDVFRLPNRASDLVVLVASGTQVFFAVAALMVVALLGYASPANRGSYMSFMIILFVFASTMGGFFTAWLTKSLHLPQQWHVIAKFACGLPCVVYLTFLFCNMVLRAARSAGAVPSIIFAMLFIMWLCALVPLTFFGAKMGFALASRKAPCRVNPIPRPINASLMPLFLQTNYLLLYSGTASFVVILFELRLIFSCLFQGLTYHFFGFLTAAFVLWSFTCGLTSVSVVYYRMCAEDYRWWWLSFAAPSSLGLHFMMFVGYFYCNVVQMTSIAATVLYVTYMTLLCLLYVLCSGSIGFLSAWTLVRAIFSSIKFD